MEQTITNEYRMTVGVDTSAIFTDIDALADNARRWVNRGMPVQVAQVTTVVTTSIGAFAKPTTLEELDGFCEEARQLEPTPQPARPDLMAGLVGTPLDNPTYWHVASNGHLIGICKESDDKYVAVIDGELWRGESWTTLEGAVLAAVTRAES